MGFLDRLLGRPPTRVLGLQQFTPDEEARLKLALSRAVGAPVSDRDLVTSKEERLLALEREFIKDLKEAIAREPAEWIYHHRLAAAYFKLRRFTDAHDSAQDALRLRPDDPRSTYAIASVYHTLVNAIYTEPESAQRLNTALAEGKISRTDLTATGIVFDPASSAAALRALGLTADQAAERALGFFSKTLDLGVSRSERPEIEGLTKWLTMLLKLRHGQTPP